MQNWKGELFLYDGKVVLITSILQTMPLYFLSAMDPTKFTINEMHKNFSRFIWSNKEKGKSRHWCILLKVCIPKEKGGWDLGPYLMCQQLCLQNYGGNSKLLKLSGLLYME